MVKGWMIVLRILGATPAAFMFILIPQLSLRSILEDVNSERGAIFVLPLPTYPQAIAAAMCLAGDI